jgi:N-acyl-D-aspartate/D-glutamate deacylase
MHDLVIRGGLVVDGLGGEPREADVAISGGRITAVGEAAGRGAEEIDAKGLLVTPGFVDLHTHYDAQATWDPILAPSSWHGVTSVVMGNCGVGFAPARPDAHSWLIEIMQEVEEIPRPVLEAGLSWDWESFPDYLDALDRRPHAIDVGAQLPHIALRDFVMGERAARSEPATSEDIETMARLTEEALRAGALGFACSRTDVHRLADGQLVPGSFADREELLALGDGVRRAGRGQVQFLGIVPEWEADYTFMRELARRAGTSVHFLMSDTNWRRRLECVEAAAADGERLVGHVPPRPVGNVLQWRSARHPFMDRPSIRSIVDLPWTEQLARLKDPAFRAQVLAEDNGPGEERLPDFARAVYRAFDRMYEVEENPDYEPDPKTDSIAARAARGGQDPAAYAYDVLMRNDGAGMIYMTLANYREGDLSEVAQLIRHPGAVVSLSDAGAHCTRVIDASAPTFMLCHWARDRRRGERLPLEVVVKLLSHDPAAAYGLGDRGVIAPGYLADVNVIDFERLRLPAPYMSWDLPGGGRRLLQKAEGYVATVKRGQVAFREGVHTGAFPGQVIRGPQPAPVLEVAS